MQSQPTTLLCRYGYDPIDRLISHTLSETPERQRFYCKNRLTTEIQGATKYSIVQHDDLLLAQQQVEGEVLDSTLLATDQQRSVLHAFKTNNQRHSVVYSSYGHRPAESGFASLLGFNGERSDPVTAHYLLGNGYRAFNPVLMRFNSSDRLSPFGDGGLNSYSYCLGDPVNRHDPNGHMSFKTIGMIVLNLTRITKSTAAARILSPAARIKYLENLADGMINTHQNAIFAKDLMAAHASPKYRVVPTLNLQAMSAEAAKSHEIPFGHMPKAIKTIINNTATPKDYKDLLDHIHFDVFQRGPNPNSKFSQQKLMNASIFGHYKPQKKPPLVLQSPAAARLYSEKVDVYPPAAHKLIEEISNIREP